MNIAQFDLSAQHAALQDALTRALTRVVASSRFVLGREVSAFENEFAEYLGGGHVVGVNSGSDALYLALRLKNVGAGDEVILPSYTFCAALEAVLRLGAVPKFVDCAPAGFNSEPDQFLAALTPRTRAVIVVHLFGAPVNLVTLRDECRHRGVAVIEDAAQALGSTLSEGKIGTHADVGCFSFYPSKNIGAFGDAGALWVASERDADRLRRLRNHGHDGNQHLHEWGINSRMDELQAAVLRTKLPHLDTFVAARAGIAAAYAKSLRSIPGITLPRSQPGHAFNQYCVRHPQRDALRQWLHSAGVETRVYYRQPLHLHPAAPKSITLPNAERSAREALALPMYPELAPASVAQVVAALLAFDTGAPRPQAEIEQLVTP